MKKLIAVFIFLILAVPTHASEISVSGNGANSNNSVIIDSGTVIDVLQTNKAEIKNNINIKANTGGNSINLGEGGTIKTGDAHVTVDIKNIINENFAKVDCPDCEKPTPNPTLPPFSPTPTSKPSENPSSQPSSSSAIGGSPVLGLSVTSGDESFLKFLFSVTSIEETSPQDAPNRIVIEKLNLDLEVKPALRVGGYWQVPYSTAAFGVGSSLPKSDGNTVIFAHARPELFGNLKSAKLGEIVKVSASDTTFTYQITEIREVLPTDTSIVNPTIDSRLTLYTCSGIGDNRRLAVIAKRVADGIVNHTSLGTF